MKKRFFLLIVAFLGLCLSFVLEGCSKEELLEEGWVRDQYGYARPENCWLTECLIFPDYAENNFTPEKLFGEGGESGLASEWALENSVSVAGNNSFLTYHLICLVYGTPPENGTIKPCLKLSYLENMQVLYDDECAGVISVSGFGDLEASYDSAKTLEERLEIAYTRNENGAVQGMVVISFVLDRWDIGATVYTSLNLDVENAPGEHRVDARDYVCRCDSERINPLTDAEISNMTVNYLTQKSYNGGIYTEDSFRAEASFEDGEFCYLVLDFTLKTLEDNDGTRSFYVMAAASERNKMYIGIEEAPTGKIEEAIHDGITTIYATYNLPSKAGEEKKVRMIFSLRPIGGGKIEVDLFVNGDKRTVVGGENHLEQTVNSNVGALSYILNEDKRSYSVSGFDNSQATVIIPAVMDDGLPVTGIAKEAFVGCSNLTSITIPPSVTYIGDRVFYGCDALESITIPFTELRLRDLFGNSVPNSLKTVMINGDTFVESFFSGCHGLVSITLPDGVTTIHDHMFSGFSALTSITIPASVTSIGNGAFTECRSLTSITIPSSVTSIGNGAFSNCSSLTSVTIPNGVTNVGERAFFNCSSLASITIPKGVTNIGEYAFCNCSSLTSITIPEGVTSIGNEAFSWCSSLTSITMPEGMTNIGEYAFCNCSSLTSITIPESVTNIGDHAFYNCSSLTLITIPEGVTNIGNNVFADCSSLTSITIPSSVTSIGDRAFYNCSSLTSITIPEGVTNIGEYAFYNCSLTSITIPEGVTSIGGNAFYNCSSLTSITISLSVTSIANGAFNRCNKLTMVYYGGNENDWNTLSTHININNRYLTSATRYYYSAEAPTEAGNWWHYDDNGEPVVWP